MKTQIEIIMEDMDPQVLNAEDTGSDELEWNTEMAVDCGRCPP